MKQKKEKNNVSSRFAYKYVRSTEGSLDECDIAIAFSSGMNYVKGKLLNLCTNPPLPRISKQILVLENFGGYYGSTVIFASDFKQHIEKHPNTVGWISLDVLLPKELLPYQMGKSTK